MPQSFEKRLLWSRRMSVPIQEGQIVFAPRGSHLLLASSEKVKAEYRAVLETRNSADGGLERRMTFAGQFRNALWSPLETIIGAVGVVTVEGEYRGVACFWDAANGRLMEQFQIGEERAFRCAAFAPDGKSLYIATHRAESQGRIYTWDITRRQVVQKIEGDGNTAFWSLAITPDGRTLAAGVGKARQAGEGWMDCAVRLYDTSTGRPETTLPRPRGEGPTGVAVSPDSRLVVTGDGPNGDVLVYDRPSGKLARSLKGHQGEVCAVTVSPNGKWIVTGGKDRTVRFWSAETGLQAASLIRHEGAVRAIAFSPDGRYLATGDDNGELLLWENQEN